MHKCLAFVVEGREAELDLLARAIDEEFNRALPELDGRRESHDIIGARILHPSALACAEVEQAALQDQRVR